VYSSPQPHVALGELVRTIDGEFGEPRGMAWVIRDDLGWIKTPRLPEPHTRILPGDLVVLSSYRGGFPGRPATHTRGPGVGREVQNPSPADVSETDRIQVAFVGLESRRPMIVALPRRHATLDHVLEQLHQRTALAPTVGVIRTNAHSGPIRRDVSPVLLVDGDVLLFKRNQLDEHGLAVAQANWPFPDSRPLDLTCDAPNEFRPSAGDERSESAATTIDLGPSQAGRGVVDDHGGRPALHEPSAGSNAAIGGSHGAAEEAADAGEWPHLMEAPNLGTVPHFNASTPQDSLHDHAEGRVPQVRTPPEDTADLQFDEAAPAVMRADHHSASEPPHFSKATGLVPSPRDPLAIAAPSAGDGSLQSMNALTIAIGVLALAGLCFMVSVVWTRIDRTTHASQESSPSGGTRVDKGKSERTTLDQLIGNRVPMIEEQVHLPDRMDYFGSELGRKRMIIDPPHATAGPHFALAADADHTERSSRERVPAAAALQQREARTSLQTEARLTRAALQIRKLRRRRPQPSAIEPHEIKPNESVGIETPRNDTQRIETETHETQWIMTQPRKAQSAITVPKSDELETSLPRVGLLERVLIAMEREKRP
jgi:hypothetical protein